MFSALLISGEVQEARSTGKELHDLALRLDASKLYMVLDAMALLACEDRNYEAAARIVACSDVAHEAHGQIQRRAAAERIRASVTAILDERLSPSWFEDFRSRHESLDEAKACALALGLWA